MDTWVVLEDLSLFCKEFPHLILAGWGNELCDTVTRCAWRPQRLLVFVCLKTCSVWRILVVETNRNVKAICLEKLEGISAKTNSTATFFHKQMEREEDAPFDRRRFPFVRKTRWEFSAKWNSTIFPMKKPLISSRRMHDTSVMEQTAKTRKILIRTVTFHLINQEQPVSPHKWKALTISQKCFPKIVAFLRCKTFNQKFPEILLS